MIIDRSTLLVAVFAIVAAVAIFIAFTKKPVYIIDNSDKEGRIALIDSLAIVIESYKLTESELDSKLMEKDSVITALTRQAEEAEAEKDEVLQVIANQTLREDSAYFALHSGTPVVITRDSNVKITPMQLKYANINIAGNLLSASIISTQSSLIAGLVEMGDDKEKLNVVQKQHIKALEETNQALTDDNVDHVQQAKVKEKEAKKEKRKAFFIGAGAGAVGVLITLLVLIN